MPKNTMLLIASTGGHLTQLVRLSERWDLSADSVWVTFDTEQSRSMLTGKNVVYVPYISPRDLSGVWLARAIIDRLLQGREFDGGVSTGAALAIAGFSAKILRHKPRYYIESISRTKGPSLTGRLLEVLRMARLHTQHPSWASNRWKLVPGVLEEFQTLTREAASASPSLFVTLGTIKPYRFDALIDAVLATGMADERTVWQLGETSRQGLPGRVVDYIKAEEFKDCVENADVTVTHAGVGTILQLLEMGECPVVVPRDPRNAEHVDGHQKLICDLLDNRQLGVVRQSDELRAYDLHLASVRSTSILKHTKDTVGGN